MEKQELKNGYYKNPLTLAYLGDSVFTLMVREFLVKQYNFKPSMLNKKANAVVCAKAQAQFMEKIRPNLTEDETDVVMRTRNTHLNSKAKNSTLHEYSLATQFEALVGYWFLNDEDKKLKDMFINIVMENL